MTSGITKIIFQEMNKLVVKLLDQKLGPYRIDREINRGGMGVILQGELDIYELLKQEILEGSELISDGLLDALRLRKQEKETDKDYKTRVGNNMDELSNTFFNEFDSDTKEKVYKHYLENVSHKHRLADRRRAIKVLAPHATDKSTIGRFKREIEICSTFDHPNIVKVIESGTQKIKLKEGEKAEEVNYAVMEYIEDTLDLEHKRVSVEDAVDIAEGILEGLIYAHENGVLHRDVKPSNVLATRDENGKIDVVKLCDFGLAKNQGMDASLTTTGTIMGTPYYLAPELAEEGENPTKESDVYSAGATFYKLLTGRPVARGSSSDQVLTYLLNKVIKGGDWSWVRDENDKIPSKIEQIVMTMVAINREERPTPQEALKLIREYRGQSNIENRKAEIKKKLRQISRAKWTFGANKHAAIASAFADLAELYEGTKEEVNSRIDSLENAISQYETYLQKAPVEISGNETIEQEIGILKKVLAVEKRRLAKLKMRRETDKPKKSKGNLAKLGIALAAAAGISAVIGMPLYSSWKRGDRLDKRINDAVIELQRGNSGRVHTLFEEARKDLAKIESSSQRYKKFHKLNDDAYEFEVNTEIKEATESLESRLFQEARDNIKQAQDISGNIVDRQKRDTLSEDLDSLEKEIVNTEKITNAEKLIEELTNHLAKGAYDSIPSTIQGIEAILGGVSEDFSEKTEETRAKIVEELHNHSKGIYEDVKKQIGDRNYSAAFTGIETIENLLSQPVLGEIAEELRSSVEKDKQKIKKYEVDSKFYKNLVGQFDEALKEYQVLQKKLADRDFFNRKEVKDLADNVGKIYSKLFGLDSEAIGQDLKKKLNEVIDTQNEIPKLTELLDRSQINYLNERAEKLDNLLTQTTDYTLDENQKKVRDAKSRISEAVQMYDNIDQSLEEFKQVSAKYSDLEQRCRRTEAEINEYNTLLQAADDQSKRKLADIYIGFGHFEKAEPVLKAITEQTGLEDRFTIINYERKFDEFRALKTTYQRIQELKGLIAKEPKDEYKKELDAKQIEYDSRLKALYDLSDNSEPANEPPKILPTWIEALSGAYKNMGFAKQATIVESYKE